MLDACAAAVPPLPVHFGAPRARRGGEEVTATESESDGTAPRSLDEWDEAFLTRVWKAIEKVVNTGRHVTHDRKYALRSEKCYPPRTTDNLAYSILFFI